MLQTVHSELLMAPALPVQHPSEEGTANNKIATLVYFMEIQWKQKYTLFPAYTVRTYYSKWPLSMFDCIYSKISSMYSQTVISSTSLFLTSN